MKRLMFAAAIGAAVSVSAPAAALDLSKLQNPLGGDWKVKSAAPDLVRFTCGSTICPPMGELAIAIRPAPDDARDEIVADPQATLAGYEKGFKNNPANKACEFSDFTAVKAGDQTARFEMRGECPSGLILLMATVFDKRQSGAISIVSSSMDGPKANTVRARAVEAVAAALSAAP